MSEELCQFVVGRGSATSRTNLYNLVCNGQVNKYIIAMALET